MVPLLPSNLDSLNKLTSFKKAISQFPLVDLSKQTFKYLRVPPGKDTVLKEQGISIWQEMCAKLEQKLNSLSLGKEAKPTVLLWV